MFISIREPAKSPLARAPKNYTSSAPAMSKTGMSSLLSLQERKSASAAIIVANCVQGLPMMNAPAANPLQIIQELILLIWIMGFAR
jgi:hypothetical protein